MTNHDQQHDEPLNHLLHRYRSACPDLEPGPRFMPGLWQRIENRRSFWVSFQELGRGAMTASAALCLLLLLLNFVTGPRTQLLPPTYADALAAEHTAEKIYYTEALRSVKNGRQAPTQ